MTADFIQYLDQAEFNAVLEKYDIHGSKKIEPALLKVILAEKSKERAADIAAYAEMYTEQLKEAEETSEYLEKEIEELKESLDRFVVSGYIVGSVILLMLQHLHGYHMPSSR